MRMALKGAGIAKTPEKPAEIKTRIVVLTLSVLVQNGKTVLLEVSMETGRRWSQICVQGRGPSQQR